MLNNKSIHKWNAKFKYCILFYCSPQKNDASKILMSEFHLPISGTEPLHNDAAWCFFAGNI